MNSDSAPIQHSQDAAMQAAMVTAIAWAVEQNEKIAIDGVPLSYPETLLARSVGVCKPELIRVLLVPEIPKPSDPFLLSLPGAAELFGPHTVGLTFGYGIYLRLGSQTSRLLSHELRHVKQYEDAGSVAAFVQVYVAQLVHYGYRNAPLEVDARAHELTR